MRHLIHIAFILLVVSTTSFAADNQSQSIFPMFGSTSDDTTTSSSTYASDAPRGTDQSLNMQNSRSSTGMPSQTAGRLPAPGANARAPVANYPGTFNTSGMLPPMQGAGNMQQGTTNDFGANLQPQTAQMPLQSPQRLDYSANMMSDIFGAQLFTGSFAQQGATQFNPDYMISIGDRLQLRVWGVESLSFDGLLAVDPQGNIFLPRVGPVKVLGIRNADLQRTVETAARRVFRSNVLIYASLAAAQPVRIFVGGFVNRPGLYNGTSMDSLLHYLDQAGGIDLERGSFLDVQVKRGMQVRATLDLYDFLLNGQLPLVQLSDGDVIFVTSRQNTVKVMGMAHNAKRFEFKNDSLTIGELSRLAKPNASTTHVRVARNTGTVKNVDYFPLADARDVVVHNGDEVEFTADKKPGTITVRVEGEHQSPQEYSLPYGTRFGELIHRIQFSDRSDTQSIQLFRLSVRDRQKTNLETSLNSLQSAVLTARSGTSEEAKLRKDEADLMLKWVDRARQIMPNGQVMLAQAENRDDLLLESGDVINIPSRDGLVLVSGEVLFPNAIAYDSKLDVGDYINRAGGYTQNADNSRIVIAHRDGSFDTDVSGPRLRAGDQVLVLPKVAVKSRQIWKDMTQIIFQIAVAAGVAFGN